MLKGCHHLVVVEGKEGRRGREREKEKEGGREGGQKALKGRRERGEIKM